MCWWRRRSATEQAAVAACREAMKRASLSFRTRSKLCCSGGAVRVSGPSRRGRHWESPGVCPSATCWPPRSYVEKSRMAGATCQAGETLYPLRERVRTRHDIGTRVGNGGRSIGGAQAQGLGGSRQAEWRGAYKSVGEPTRSSGDESRRRVREGTKKGG